MKFLHWTCSLLSWFMNPLHSQLLGTSCIQVMFLRKFLSQKSSPKRSLDFQLKKLILPLQTIHTGVTTPIGQLRGPGPILGPHEHSMQSVFEDISRNERASATSACPLSTCHHVRISRERRKTSPLRSLLALYLPSSSLLVFCLAAVLCTLDSARSRDSRSLHAYWHTPSYTYNHTRIYVHDVDAGVLYSEDSSEKIQSFWTWARENAIIRHDRCAHMANKTHCDSTSIQSVLWLTRLNFKQLWTPGGHCIVFQLGAHVPFAWSVRAYM